MARAPLHRVAVRAPGGTGVEIGVSAGQHETFPMTVPMQDRIQPADLDGDGRPEWLVLPAADRPAPGLTVLALPH